MELEFNHLKALESSQKIELKYVLSIFLSKIILYLLVIFVCNHNKKKIIQNKTCI